MGANNHKVVFYGLSTCIHCKHAREFLEKNNIEFELNYVDLAEGDERNKLLSAVKEYNPSISFPTIIIDDGKKVIVGFQPEELQEALEI